MRRHILGSLIGAFAALFMANAVLAADATPSPLPAPGITPGQVDYQYRLGAGDKIRIIVFGEDSLTGEFYVSDSGTIAFPLVGAVKAGGLTIPELQQNITDKLADGYLKMPRVSAEVLNYRPFFILGEVMKPGTYPYTTGLTVLNAVATAEGFTYRADTKKVYIKRAASDKESAQPLTSSTEVQPGDTIRIGERLF